MKNKMVDRSSRATSSYTTWWFLCSSLMTCLLIPHIAWAAYWIGDYSGEQEEYRLIRNGKVLKVEAETLLQAGDELKVLSETGMLQLWKEDDEGSKTLLKKENPIFIVPESEAPPGVISNLSTLLVEWVTRASTEEVTSKTLSTRGDAPVLLLGATDWKNQVPRGSGSFVAYWSGGQPPYRIRLTDDDDNVIAEKTNIKENNITLTGLNIPVGEYGLKVWGESSSSYIQLDSVEEKALPPLYSKIVDSSVPEKVKRKYAVLTLASHPEWLFYSLQLAERYDLQEIKQKILARDVPDLIDESRF